MISRRWLLTASVCTLALGTPGSLSAEDDSFKAPDSLRLKNGSIIKGLIIKNTRDAVILQEEFGEKSFPKSEIVRIYDNPDLGIAYTNIDKKGELPAWRVIANDLRTRDAIKSLVEIPATVIDTGEFKNVPYTSFRLNQNGELNIYGDPDDPAGLEIGLYGSRGGNDRFRKVLRSYIAGLLNTREEVAALYSLPLNGGINTAGDLTIEITPKHAPDAYGAWWISIYNKKSLDAVRLNDAEYARLTRPLNEVMDKDGKLVINGWTNKEADLSQRIADQGKSARIILRGFYRDKNGDFRLIPASQAN